MPTLCELSATVNLQTHGCVQNFEVRDRKVLDKDVRHHRQIQILPPFFSG